MRDFLWSLKGSGQIPLGFSGNEGPGSNVLVGLSGGGVWFSVAEMLAASCDSCAI